MSRVGVVLIAVAIAFCGSRADASPITYQYLQTSTTVPGVLLEASITTDLALGGLPNIGLNCAPGPACTHFENGAFATLPACPPNCVFSPDFGNLLDFKLHLQGGVQITLDGFPILFPGKRWDILGNFITYNDTSTSFSLGFNPAGAGAINFSSEAGGGCYLERCFTEGVWVPTPEPGSMLLMGSGLAALAARFRRRRDL